MVLIAISFALGIVGFFLGASIGGEFWAAAFGIIGVLSPAIYVLDRLYRGSKQKDEFTEDMKIILENLKDNGIITDEEFEKAASENDEAKEVDDGKIKFDAGVNVLYNLWKAKIVSDDEYQKRISLLKKLYKQD